MQPSGGLAACLPIPELTAASARMIHIHHLALTCLSHMAYYRQLTDRFDKQPGTITPGGPYKAKLAQ